MVDIYLVVGETVHGFWTSKKDAISYFKTRNNMVSVIRVYIKNGKYKTQVIYTLLD